MISLWVPKNRVHSCRRDKNRLSRTKNKIGYTHIHLSVLRVVVQVFFSLGFLPLLLLKLCRPEFPYLPWEPSPRRGFLEFPMNKLVTPSSFVRRAVVSCHGPVPKRNCSPKQLNLPCPCMLRFYRYPSQKEWERKEQLYLNIIDLLEKGKHWEHAVPLCKELSMVYESKVFNYRKLAEILKRQASFFEKIISSSEQNLRLSPEYFRVGFYGNNFPPFLKVSIICLSFQISCSNKLSSPVGLVKIKIYFCRGVQAFGD